MISMSADHENGVFRFGAYEADPASGELRKSGFRMRVQEQPFRVLLMLLERPAEVVTREELRQKLWPADTFVDFEHSLNTVVNKLREALSDSASNPRFVETLARRGYRFLPPVEFVPKQIKAATAPVESVRNSAPKHVSKAPTPDESSLLGSVLTRGDKIPALRRSYVRSPFSLIQVMYLSFYLVALIRLRFVHELLERNVSYPAWALTLLVFSSVIGLPIRLYLISAVVFDLSSVTQKFHRLVPVTLLVDELWALSPFLLTAQIGLGAALAATAALLYLPFAQRTLLLMGDRPQPAESE
jgi:cholera toxin transcriptional activator